MRNADPCSRENTAGYTFLTLMFCNHFQDDEDQGREFGRAMEGEEGATEQTHHIIIPSYASWFDYNW